MASSVTKYHIYTTEDQGQSLAFQREVEAYTRKEAIGKLLSEDDDLRTKVTDTDTPEDERPSFVVAPSSLFLIVTPKIETKVDISF